jgi:hypothetical protein
MKKYFYLVIAILGVGLVGYSVTQGWATFEMPMAGIKSHPMMGYKFIQGILAAVFAAAALGLLFFKPKIAIVPALLVIGMAAWFYTNPPILEDIQYNPEKIVIGAMLGGLLLAVSGLIAPKKA